MLADIQYALRQLRRSPGFALTAILTLALGIGANIAIFTLINSMLLRPLPFADQARLMRIDYSSAQADTTFFPKGWIRALSEHSKSFSAVAAFGPDAESNVGDGGSPARVFGVEVTANALDTLGIHPAAGRFFTTDDAIAGHEPTVVLSYGYWREHYGSSPAAIGQTVRIDGVSRRIAGVMPAGIRFPYADTQFLTPITFKGDNPLDPWATGYDLRAFGRLRQGVTPGQAQAELRSLQRQLLPLFPWRMPDIWASEMTVLPLLESQVGALRPRLLLLFAAVGLILLIACANVANLMLARAAGREREIAIRGALGATGSRLVRQLLSESAVVGVLAGVVGLLAAWGSVGLLVRLLPADTPRAQDVSLGWPVMAFAAGASLMAALLFGFIPALKMAKPALGDALHLRGRGTAGKVGQFRVSMILVMGQIALSVLVITGAGLLLHSLWRLSQVDPGFKTERVMTAEVSLDASACQAKGHCDGFFRTLLEQLKGMPDADKVALTDSVPLTAQAGGYVYDAENHPRDARQGALLATGRKVTPSYFAALGLTLAHGRLLDQQDLSGATRAVVINQRMAERLWPHQDPIGKHLLAVGDEPQPTVWVSEKAVTVVGVVNNTHENGLATDFGEEVYLPMTPDREQPVLYVLLRTRTTTRAAADELRSAVAGVDAQVPVTRIRTLNEVVAASQSAPRSLAILLLVFGALALAIGGVGVYSLIAYIVSWRTREIGIRLALGAQRSQIVGAVVRQSLMLALGGAAAGLIGAAFAGKLLQRFLFDVKAVDPVTYVGVAGLMTVLALLAAWIPARRAASVDPIQTLRLE
ncbi:ABC transporter permease [Occallatibacter riparius]|uniref:ABC transporter permease n=1 Tax=Occallatibacter riparius TaxID=1002689 RepID=A0A9J7BMD6_9BACT|nr:ABC transporter permease [Occallatibacter riparius]UWZ83799.1 ABC transporter permease [Occallatibacter riparius]